jgi:hypothetical protein
MSIEHPMTENGACATAHVYGTHLVDLELITRVELDKINKDAQHNQEHATTPTKKKKKKKNNRS